MHTGAFAHALPGAFRHTALVQRLCAFVCASIALHALILAAYSPNASGLRSQRGASAPVLHARLATAPADPVSNAPAGPHRSASGTGLDTSSSEAAPASSTGDRLRAGGADIPLPEKWYTATELSVLAQPLVMPVLRYPEALAGSGVSARVRVKVFVDERGAVRKTEIVESGPHPAFDAAAVSAWDEMRFSPAIRDGTAVKSQKLLELDFEP
jgi:TonB family protein